MADDSAVNDQSASLPDPVSQWLSEIAEEQDITEEELLHRFLHPEGDGDSPPVSRDTIEELGHEIEATREEFQEKIEDVRQRVIQVKREADQKATADHAHPEVETAFSQLQQQVDDFEGELAELEYQLTEGFENFQEILEYLTETTESLDTKLATLARAVMNLRTQNQSLAERHDRDLVLQRILDAGNREHVTRAECQSCEEKIDLSLLSSPACPNCQELFSDLEVNKGFFKSSVLKTESVPALEGESEQETFDLSDIVSEDATEEESAQVTPGDLFEDSVDEDSTDEDSFSDDSIPAGEEGRTDNSSE